LPLVFNVERQLFFLECAAVSSSFGSTAGTPGTDRLARNLPFTVVRQAADGRVRPDPATSGCSRPSGSGARFFGPHPLRPTRRPVRFGTVKHRSFDMSNACKPSVDGPTGRWMTFG